MNSRLNERNPYVGPRAFRPDEQHLFFGRDREASELLTRIRAYPVVLFYAQSGAGKTSLLNAKVVPLLKKEGFEVLPLARIQGSIEDIQLEEITNLYVFNTSMSWKRNEVSSKQLIKMSLKRFLSRREQLTDEEELPLLFSVGIEYRTDLDNGKIPDQLQEEFAGKSILLYPDAIAEGQNPRWLIKDEDQRTYLIKHEESQLNVYMLPLLRVVIFDQFEELFTTYPERWKDREAFFRQIADALEADAFLRVVFAIREDYIARLDPYAFLLPGRLRVRFRLEGLRREAAQKAITGPVEITGRTFSEGVAEELVDGLLKNRVSIGQGRTVEVMEEFVEPVQLQVVCQDLWENLPPNVKVVTSEYVNVLGVEAALSRFYEKCIRRAVQETGVNEDHLRWWFADQLITPEGTRGIVYRGGSNTVGIPNVTVDFLDKLHLIREEVRGGSRWYELIHDRFIKPIQTSYSLWKHRQMKPHEIIQSLEQIVKFDPTADGYVVLAEAYRLRDTSEDRNLAIERLEKALELAPKHANAYYSLGLIYKEMGRYSDAIDSFENAIEFGDIPWAYADLGETYRLRGRDGDYDQAAKNLKTAIELDPNHRGAHHSLGLTYRDLGRYSEAIDSFKNAMQIDPNAAEVCIGLSEAYRLRGTPEDYDLAINNLTRVIHNLSKQEREQGREAYHILGLTYRDLGRYSKAIDSFKTAMQIDPNAAEACIGLGETYRLRGGDGDYDRAIKSLKQAIELNPDHRDAHHSLGLTYKDMEEYKRAIDSFKTATRIDPNVAEPYAGLGETYRLRGRGGDYDRAIKSLKQAIELNPDHRDAYHSLGLTYQATKQYAFAIEAFQSAIDIGPTAWAYAQLGGTCRLKGEYLRAIEKLDQAIELDPDNSEHHLMRAISKAEQDLTTEHLEEAYNSMNEILAENMLSRRLDAYKHLSLRFVVIASLILQERTNEASRELGEFIRYYCTNIPADAEHPQNWSYLGIRNFIQNRQMDENSRNLILELINLLEAPKSKERIRAFEAALD